VKKTAVVTGGAGGIGRAVAERFASDAYELVLIDLNAQAGAEVAAEWHRHGSELVFHQADLTQENAVKHTFEKIIDTHGRIDALINVAGGSLHRHSLGDFPLAHWEAVIAANLTSTFLCCRAVIEPMQKQKSGTIVNISSDIAFSGDAGRSAYAAAKAGILGLTRSLALELAATAIRVNAVAPGRIATARVRANYTDAEWEAAAKRIPMGHAGAPEDVAETVYFLASDAAKHMTGQTIHVNGGRIMT
jgi:NAD(P)-dependent dehydrogenase (short-subunit alcohol dehydrogenase family)